MEPQRLRTAFPYALLLAAAAWFYHLATHIQYAARPGQIGPDFWPHLALGAMIAICAVEIGRILAFGGNDQAASNGAAAKDEDEEEGQAPRQPLRLVFGIAAVVAYGALITIFGFPLTTAAFMILFIYAGGYRQHLSIWLSSLIGVVILTVIFRSLVYVSLPRGEPPFDVITDVLARLF